MHSLVCTMRLIVTYVLQQITSKAVGVDKTSTLCRLRLLFCARKWHLISKKVRSNNKIKQIFHVFFFGCRHVICWIFVGKIGRMRLPINISDVMIQIELKTR